MTRIKLCGLRRQVDIDMVNLIMPEYIGFIFTNKSPRYIDFQGAKKLRSLLNENICPVGIFVDEPIDKIKTYIKESVIDAVQLHGSEGEDYIREIKTKTNSMIIKAFQINNDEDLEKARRSSADMVLLDSGAGSGKIFNWGLVKEINRPYFLAGGLGSSNVGQAIGELSPYGVDASSLLESDGYKDKEKMFAFVKAVREADKDGKRYESR